MRRLALYSFLLSLPVGAIVAVATMRMEKIERVQPVRPLAKAPEEPPLPPPPAPPLRRAVRADLHREIEAFLDAPSFSVRDPHDACGLLIDIGDRSSVKYALAVLRALGPARPGEGMVCTAAHCLRALEKITGHAEGTTAEAWERWLRANGYEVEVR